MIHKPDKVLYNSPLRLLVSLLKLNLVAPNWVRSAAVHTGSTSEKQTFPCGNAEFRLPWEGGQVWRH